MIYDAERFVFRKFYSVAFKKLIDESNKIHWHVSKRSEGILHVVFTSEDDYSDNEVYEVAQDFVKHIMAGEKFFFII